jgi:starvation-inducible DNA-binding protein
MHETCEEENDIATANLIENWVDDVERRSWFEAENQRSLINSSV